MTNDLVVKSTLKCYRPKLNVKDAIAASGSDLVERTWFPSKSSKDLKECHSVQQVRVGA